MTDLRTLLESAVDAGVFTTMTVPVSEVQNDDRVDGFDWDAYPYTTQNA